MFAAIGYIVFFISVTLFCNGITDQLPLQRGIIIYILFFPVALACSRSLNVIVTMIKTINIASIARRGIPVQINNTAVFVVSFATFLIWLTLNTSDVILIWTHFVHIHRDAETDLTSMLLYSSLVGDHVINVIIFIIAMRYDSNYNYSTAHRLMGDVTILEVTIHFALPSLISLISMVIQAHSIKTSLRHNSNSNQLSASYINMTIFMVTALFCFCHTTYFVYIVCRKYCLTYHLPYKLYLSLFLLFDFTLPLINAALFPLIIILRKQSLRERYRDSFLHTCSLLVGVGLVW